MLDAGDEFGNYQIEEYIAAGGQAEVYRAVHKQDNKTVALKIFHSELSPADWQLFQEEINAIRSLRGPNIIPMFAWGEENFPTPATRDHKDDGGNKRLYLAMHYVDRKHYVRADLRAVLDNDGPLQPEVALALLWPVARALETVHQKGRVHMDVKPSNILVESGAAGLIYSQVFLADFGITQRETVFTRGGEVGFSGTLPYIAPEQLAGSTPTARADIYSLGCVAFEMLTNMPPYFGAFRMGVNEVIAAIKIAPTPRLTDYQKELRQVTDQQASTADQVLAKALDKNPDHRHETAVKFMQALEEAFITTRPSARTRPRFIARRTPVPMPQSEDTAMTEIERCEAVVTLAETAAARVESIWAWGARVLVVAALLFMLAVVAGITDVGQVTMALIAAAILACVVGGAFITWPLLRSPKYVRPPSRLKACREDVATARAARDQAIYKRDRRGLR